MTTFGVVHGAWAGAWCWELLEPELQMLGHRVVAVDLPCDDPSASFTTYAEVVVSALAAEQGDLVLVGHSLGGLTVPIAAARLPARRIVFLCAFIAAPGRSFLDQLQAEPQMFVPQWDVALSDPDEQGRRRWADFDATWRALFSDCDEALARSTFDRLRPQAMTLLAEPCPLQILPEVERSYIACSDDRIVNPDWGRHAARERLGVEPMTLPGSHCPMLSRPAELARLLSEES